MGGVVRSLADLAVVAALDHVIDVVKIVGAAVAFSSSGHAEVDQERWESSSDRGSPAVAASPHSESVAGTFSGWPCRGSAMRGAVAPRHYLESPATTTSESESAASILPGADRGDDYADQQENRN